MPSISSAPSISTSGFGLNPDFAANLATLLKTCLAAGHEFRISQGLRTPQKQAEYYCQWNQRPPAKIDLAAANMEKDGAPWLASVLRSYRDIPRTNKWLTSQLPGSGWHQWGEAADCYCYRDGHMVSNGSDPAYKFYADEAIKLGLTPGYYFKSQDSGHVQARPQPGATSVYTWAHINDVMKQRFGDKDEVALTPGVSVLALATGGEFYRDDPDLIVAKIEPDMIYELPGGSSALNAMARTYNEVGGLLDRLGAELGIDPIAVLSVLYVESGGRSFLPGRPVLRLENHKLYKYWGKNNEAKFDKHFQFGGHAGIGGSASENHKFRPAGSGPWKQSHIGGANNQDNEYEAFALAESISDHEAASLSSSFGAPQIMGFNHEACGYSDATSMVEAFGQSPRWQVLAFFDFCRSNDLIEEIADQQWVEFGQIYNGNGSVYGPKLEEAYGHKHALLALPKIPNP